VKLEDALHLIGDAPFVPRTDVVQTPGANRRIRSLRSGGSISRNSAAMPALILIGGEPV
jgi:hypothetical protein